MTTPTAPDGDDLMTNLRRKLESLTAPDGDRLPATNNGQETCVCGHDWDSEHEQTRLMGGVCTPTDGSTCNCASFRPAPQQPPAQEREGIDCHNGAHGLCLIPEHCGCRCHDLATAVLTPPSEADSAGEDGVERAARAYYIAWNNDNREWAAKAWDDMGGSEPSQERTEIVLAMTEAVAALAASSGVRGGDGYEPDPSPAQTPPAHAHTGAIGGDGEALHEWPCPNCGAVTRARMADHEDGEARERLADVLENRYGKYVDPLDHHPAAWRLDADHVLAALRAAGGGRS